MTDAETLRHYIAVWWEAVNSFARVLEKVPAEQWSTPTDLPGWDVHAVAAHTAHLEALLSGRPHDDVEVVDAPHARGMLGEFTEQGVLARRTDTPDALISEIHEAATARHTTLLSDPPTDPAAPAPGVFGAMGWPIERLLRNRPLDVWMHEQDVRRAVGLPGNLESPPATHTITYLMESFPLVVAKRAAAPAGTTARLSVAGQDPVYVVVDDDGRGNVIDQSDARAQNPSVALAMDASTFVVLAGGRATAAPEAVEASGDADLAARILAAMAVTP